MLIMVQEVARAWALAGAKGVVLIGRSQELLVEPTSAINEISPSTQVLALTADLTSDSDVSKVFTEAVRQFGAIDVVVHAAGKATEGVVGDLEPQAWFTDYELNVKASYIVVHHYLKTSRTGTIIFLGTLGASFTFPGMSAYSGSKLALMKLAEFLDVEQPNLRVFTVHPGIVAVTETSRGAVVDALTPFAKDKGIQTGGLSLYLAQEKADYLRGGFISVNCESTNCFRIVRDLTRLRGCGRDGNPPRRDQGPEVTQTCFSWCQTRTRGPPMAAVRGRCVVTLKLRRNHDRIRVGIDS